MVIKCSMRASIAKQGGVVGWGTWVSISDFSHIFTGAVRGAFSGATQKQVGERGDSLLVF